jgi:hypothetical protein
VTAQFDHDCTICHSTAVWQPSTFNHATSIFPLTGTHATTRCQDCHLNGNYTTTPTDCYSCHQTDFNNSTNPNHVTGNYPHNCVECHSTTDWTGAAFDHNRAAFPLTGAHQTVECTQCHVNGQFSGTPQDCFACHEQRFNGTTNPNHVTNQFSHTCQQCHSTTAWTPSTFNHANTTFPLTGAHTSTACNLCHVNGQYANTPTACYACHEANFTQVTDPNHVTGNYDHNCTVCHSTTAWTPASIDHSTTAFPLTGAHTTVACAQCHVNGQFHGTPADCYTCHLTNYAQVTDPNHVVGNYNHTCTICHSTTAWSPATIDHSTTAFPLTGAHTTVACALCHVNGQFNGTTTDCYTCHTTNYNNAANHQSSQYPHTCTTCHNTTAWQPSTFNHATTAFPLTGAHITTACQLCHVNGQFAGTPSDCYFCHQTDYNGATNPNHNAAHFPTACQTCHTTITWNGATFDHDGPYFPIYSGNHRNEWTTCADCHTNAADFAVFSCITCHEHSRSNTDGEHDEVSGYTYTATSCYTCHPRGNGGDRSPHIQNRQRNDR